MKLYTITEAATALGWNARTVRRRVVELGIGTKAGRIHLLTAADLAKLRKSGAPKVGNPLMGQKQPKHYRRASNATIPS